MAFARPQVRGADENAAHARDDKVAGKQAAAQPADNQRRYSPGCSCCPARSLSPELASWLLTYSWCLL